MTTPIPISLARGNYLRPNGHGGYLIRQSDLSSWSRCQLQKFYNDRAQNDPEAIQPKVLSATEYGSVVHYVVMVMEQRMHEGELEGALEEALRLWEHYWDLDNMLAIPGVERITEWLPRQSFGGLRERGRITIRTYYSILKEEKSWPLALEYQFAVPLEIDGRLHTFTGTIDRLSIRQFHAKPYISVDDNKTGKRPTYLRYNMQGTGYAFATTVREFWEGWADSGMGDLEVFPEKEIARVDKMFKAWGYALLAEEVSDDLKLASRRFRWIDLKEIKFVDGGWRMAQDYERFKLAVDSYVRSCEAEVYGVNTTGEICRYCEFKHACGGVGLAPETAGAP